MSTKTLPILFLNLGGEMLYILDQRLRAQSIPQEKAQKGRKYRVNLAGKPLCAEGYLYISIYQCPVFVYLVCYFQFIIVYCVFKYKKLLKLLFILSC